MMFRWMSPESIGEQKYSEKSDVWADGVVLFEIVTGHEPFQGEDILQVAVRVRDQGYSVMDSWPRNGPEYVRNLAAKCFAADPSQRPSFGDICNYLDDYVPKGYQKGSTLETNRNVVRASPPPAPTSNPQPPPRPAMPPPAPVPGYTALYVEGNDGDDGGYENDQGKGYQNGGY
jgi:serine/threonine-protein kinase